MKKINKGFTIVELVIVIVVIDILAAVLIPTFSGVIEKANKSAAMQAAHNEYEMYLAENAKDLTGKGISCPRNDMLMTIFNQMTISEHTGHGVPIIVKKYGKEAFEISDKYVKITIPFDSEVMVSIENGGNSGDNNEVIQIVISCILEDESISAAKISSKTSISQRTVERAIAKLKAEGIIERVGGTRGKWIVRK